MRIYIDTEFNGFRGSLLSIGMVTADGRTFYETQDLLPGEKVDPWVRDNVLPKLEKAPIPRAKLQAKLMAWLLGLAAEPFVFVVDHPADAIHLCHLLECDEPPGAWLEIGNFHIEFVVGLPGTASTSTNPHHALDDAFALRESHMERLGL